LASLLVKDYTIDRRTFKLHCGNNPTTPDRWSLLTLLGLTVSVLFATASKRIRLSFGMRMIRNAKLGQITVLTSGQRCYVSSESTVPKYDHLTTAGMA
jgi:hypothetical protein